MQIVSFEAPDPPKGGLWSYAQALEALPITKDRFYELIRVGVFPKGIVRHPSKKPRFTRKHMAYMLAYLEHESDFNPPLVAEEAQTK